MTLSTYVTIALGLVVSALLARSLGPDDYGRYAYLLWLVGLLVALGNHGIPVTATRLISEALANGQAEPAGALQRTLQHWQSASLVAVGLGFVALSPWLQPAGWTEQHLLLLGMGLVCFVPKSLYQLGSSLGKGHGAFWVEAWGNMLISVFYTLGVAVLAWQHASLWHNLVWLALVSVLNVAVILPMLRRANIRASQARLPIEWVDKVRHHVSWTGLQVVMSALSNRSIEIYLLGRWVGPAEVGRYAIAANLTRGGIELLSSGLSTLLMPSLSRAKGLGGYAEVNRLLTDACRYFFFLGLFLAGVGVLWSGPGVALIYGERYASLVPALRWMVLLSGLLLLDNPVASTLLIIDDQRVRTARAVGMLGVGAITAVALVPSYGLMGAVAASGLSSALVFFACAVHVSRLIGFSPPWRDLRRLALSALLAAVPSAALLTWDSGLGMQALAGLVYAMGIVVAAAKTGVWKRHDIALMCLLSERHPRWLGRWQASLMAWQARAEP